MKQIFDCRFLNTAKHLSDEDIAPAELDSQLQEFIDQAKALLCGEEYFELSDIYDNLVLAFDEVLRGENQAQRAPPSSPKISSWTTPPTAPSSSAPKAGRPSSITTSKEYVPTSPSNLK